MESLVNSANYGTAICIITFDNIRLIFSSETKLSLIKKYIFHRQFRTYHTHGSSTYDVTCSCRANLLGFPNSALRGLSLSGACRGRDAVFFRNAVTSTILEEVTVETSQPLPDPRYTLHYVPSERIVIEYSLIPDCRRVVSYMYDEGPTICSVGVCCMQ